MAIDLSHQPTTAPQPTCTWSAYITTLCSLQHPNLNSDSAVSHAFDDSGSCTGRWAKGRPQWVEQMASTAQGAESADGDVNGLAAVPGSEAAGRALAAGRAAREAAAQAAALSKQLHSTDATAQVSPHKPTTPSAHEAMYSCELRCYIFLDGVIADSGRAPHLGARG